MRVCRSNRTERLLDTFASDVANRPLSPHEPEIVVVQSHAMRAWLSLQLAARNDICAHTRFLSPKKCLAQMLDALLDDTEEASAATFESEQLRWAVAMALPLTDGLPPELRSRIDEDADDLVHLSGRFARTISQHALRRPDIALGWEASPDTSWQASLWNEVCRRHGNRHLPRRAKDAQAAVSALARNEAALEQVRQRGLPRRVHLFAVDSVAPMQAHLFALLSRIVETTLYLVRPSVHYWGDDRARKHSAADVHPLLSQCGRLSREFEDTLLEVDSPEKEVDLFEEPNPGSHLGRLHGALLYGASFEFEHDSTLEPRDRIMVHACPTRMREVQVVRDSIRHRLEIDPTLQPEDILIVAPHMERYAALIDAEFAEGENPAIPTHRVDPETLLSDPWVRQFFKIGEFVASRWTRDDLLELLGAGALHEDHLWSARDVDHARELVEKAGIRWGLDGAHRASFGFPDDSTHGWRMGLDRLLVGYGLGVDEQRSFQKLASVHPSTRTSANVSARLAAFVEMLAPLCVHPEDRRPIDSWMARCAEIARNAMSNNHANAQSPLFRATRSIAQGAGDVGFDTPIRWRAALQVLKDELGTHVQRRALETSGVAVGELIPFRAVPYRWVFFMGMGAGDFPRSAHRETTGFSDATHRFGDRDRRTDDLHALLSHVLCARTGVVVTYCSEAGSAEASHAVTALLKPPSDSASSDIEFHALHEFDARYFDGSTDPQSYSSHTLDVANAIYKEPASPTEPSVAILHSVEDGAVSVDQLAAALWHAPRAFYQDRLGIYFERRAGDLDPEAISALQMWKTGSDFIERVETIGQEEAARWVDAQPSFPSGATGDFARDQLRAEAMHVAAQAERVTLEGSKRIESLVEGVRLYATVSGLRDRVRTTTTFSRAQQRAELTAWLEHLVLNTAGPATTQLICRNHRGSAQRVEFAPVENAAVLLGDAIAVYCDAMRTPLPLFPKSSVEFARRIENGSDESDAFHRASGVFHTRDSDNADPYVTRAFRDRDPFTSAEISERFRSLSKTVHRPWLQHRVEP